MFIDRPIVRLTLERALARSPAVALLGPRQVGKTTLALEIARSFDGAVYLDLEHPADLRKLADAADFLGQQAGKLSVIDEIHRVPHLFAELRSIVDERRRSGNRTAQFLLLGSASLDLIQKASETLAGRIAYIELDPLNITETAAAGIATDQVWLRGGFPESLTATSDASSFEWRQDFVRSYLERDVPMFAPRVPSTSIGRVWAMLANGQGTPLNVARLAQGLGVSAHAVNRYIDLLADLLLVRRLQPWSGNLGKRLVRAPKIYLRDSGVVHALLEIETLNQLLGHPIVGPSWEGFVIENLIQAAGRSAIPLYFRTADGAEIDLVFERAGKPWLAVEIKRSTAPKITANFRKACDDLEIEHRFIVSGGSDRYVGAGGVEVHSLASAAQAIIDLTR